MKNTKRAMSRLHGLTPASLATAAVGLGIAGAKGLGLETELPDGSTIVDTLPTYVGAIITLLAAIGTGSGVLSRALLAPPTDGDGNASSGLTISVAIGQAFRENNPELVAKLQETCALLKTPPVKAKEEQTQ